MVEQRERSLILLARIQAAIGLGLAVIIFALYGVKPELLNGINSAFTIALLGVACAIYFLTIHQVMGRQRLALSTLILTLTTASNLTLVIASTGGLDSPYYSLWLLAIVVAGIFGAVETLVVLSVTVVYFAIELSRTGFQGPNLRDHLVQLFITFLAAGLAEWVHIRSRRAVAQSTKLASISGRLTEEQLKAQALMSSIGDGVMVVDVNRQIQLFNKAAQELTGWDEASAQSIDYNLVLKLKTAKDEDIAATDDPFTQLWAKKGPLVRDDLFMTTRSGRKIQINMSISPIADNAGNPTGAIALFRDISHEKEVERQKDEFVSTASHEMRTPVAAIEGYISLAMNPNVASVDDRAKKYLDKAHEAIQHLGELFRDLLSVTKAEEGALNAKIEAVNVGPLLQDAVEDMQFVAQKKNLTLVLQTASTVGKALSPLYYVGASPERLREVVMNLIDNAIKYTDQGGIKVSMTGNDKEVQISISDTGPGIAAEDVPHLFQKFYRIDNSATRTIGGNGLGLYLCRRIMEVFNGRIWVDSKLGAGSTFNVSLPRLKEDDIKRLQTNLTTEAAPVAQGTPGAVVTPQSAPRPMPKPAPTSGPAILPQPVPQLIPAKHDDMASHPRHIS